MVDLVEPRVRRVVAEHLGVEPEELAGEVSLIDELAADSLDLVELALELEAQFGIVIPESTIEELRTYADVVQTVLTLMGGQREAEVRAEETSTPPVVWTRVIPAQGETSGDLQRVGWLTPYTAETIAEDALRAGRGARLEVTVPANVSDANLALLHDQFAWLGNRGVQVNVRRDQQLGSAGRRPHEAA